DRIIAGEFLDQFRSDMIQGGAGTTTNMNVNEVVANVALEWLGHRKGDYHFLSPNDHVNCSQSTNDAYPTAFRVALINRMHAYSGALALLGDAFRGFATNLDEELARIDDASRLLAEVNMGATAIGTSVNAPPGYPDLVVRHLAEVTGLPLRLAVDLVEATSDAG